MEELTPTHRLTINDNKIYIKRDDLLPFSFGGNKARKAQEYFDLIDLQKKDTVVTYGSTSSNHARVIAGFCAKRNLQCFIICPEEEQQQTFNTQLMELSGAKIIYCKIAAVKKTIEDTIGSLERKGFSPYFIYGGGHGYPGTVAYVKAYSEIVRYEKQNQICFDYIFHASGTGGTQAGLICGQIENEDFFRKIIGISIARKKEHALEEIEKSILQYCNKNKREPQLELINFVDDYTCGGYGRCNTEIIEIIKKTWENQGVPLDCTYTGKAFYGMQEIIKKEHIKNKNILFIHTGGTPLFFEDLKRGLFL